MHAVIVGKTRMGGAACIGALAVDTGESLRLKPLYGEYPLHTAFEVGTIWDLDFTPCLSVEPPHVEDVIVARERYVGFQERLARFVLDRIDPWHGSPERLFDGLIRFTGNGRGYVTNRVGIPRCSTGFWVPDRRLSPCGGDYFQYGDGYPHREVKYVGIALAPNICPANNLLRVSLARWWRPDDAPDFELRCYLQLSGRIA